MNKKLIGRIEKVNFPQLGIPTLKAKVDTGAYSIALHVDYLRVCSGKLHFRIGDSKFVYDKFKSIEIKNSFGQEQKRFCIFTLISIGNSKYKVHISLTNRKKMKYPVLIGRRFLSKFNYLVDVKKKYVNDTDKKV